MDRETIKRLALWMLVFAFAALVWEAPGGIRNFRLTSLPTQISYSVLAIGGAVLLAGGAWLLLTHRWEYGVILIGCAAAGLLAVNQAAGVAFGSLLCFSPG